jgi:hypothetical protein
MLRLSKRARVLWFLAVFILVGGLACWFGITGAASRGLSYKGKPIEYWFNQLPMTKAQLVEGKETIRMSDKMRKGHTPSGAVRMYGSWVEEPQASAQAIRALGSNGIAFYFRRLKRQDLPIRNKIQQAAFRVGVGRFVFEDVDAERGQAVTALILLKPLPPGPASELVTLSKNSNGAIAAAARCVLATGASFPWLSPSNFAGELDKPFAVPALSRREVTNRAFRPSTLILDNHSLWGAEKPSRQQTSPDTNKWSLSTPPP